MPSTALMWQVTATVDGISLGTFDTHSGGEITADIARYRPGGMGDQIVFPQMAEVGDLTITRYWDAARDADAIRRLRARVGLANATITVQALSAERRPLAGSGTRRTYSGILSGITEPESDASSGDPATFELTFAVGAPPA